MRKRLLCLGLVAVATQLFGTGCGHIIARYRANHPCGACAVGCGVGDRYHPLLHPIQTRRAFLAAEVAPPVGPAGGPAYGPGVPPCHGCGEPAPAFPVSYGPYPVGGDIVPSGMPGGFPSIGQPMPILPGPTVIPQGNGLPMPMEVQKPKDGGNGGK